MTEQILSKRKRDLLPLWIKVFLWIFLFMGSILPVIIVFSLMDYSVSLAIYGVESDTVFSAIGFILTCLIAYKGVIAYGLWTEKKWAITYAIYDAKIGIVACVVSMILPLIIYSSFHFSLRLELIALVPYLFKMQEIKKEWNDDTPSETINTETNIEEKIEITDLNSSPTIYSTHTYQCEDGTLTIDQEFQNPNKGENVFLNGKPAPFGKYKLGFMSFIFVNNGVIEDISNF
jgi:hypothetical protein